jgi:uncharacterized lipoprotein
MRHATLLRTGFLPAVVLAFTVAGCSFFGDGEPECESVEDYQSAQSAPRVAVPAGLDTPEMAGRLDVPEEPLPAEPLARNAACLQRPPNYFDRPLNAPPTPAPPAPAGPAGPPED